MAPGAVAVALILGLAAALAEEGQLPARGVAMQLVAIDRPVEGCGRNEQRGYEGSGFYSSTAGTVFRLRTNT